VFPLFFSHILSPQFYYCTIALGEGGGGGKGQMKSLFCHNGIKVDPWAWVGLVGAWSDNFLTSCSMRVCHSFSGLFFFSFFLVGGVSFSILEKTIKNEKATVNSTLGVVHPKAFF